MQQEGRPGATSLAASILNCHDGIPPPEKRREVRYQTRKYRRFQVKSVLPSRTDVIRPFRHVRLVPILLQKSFSSDERKFLGPLTRFTRGDVRDHIVSSKIDHGPRSGVEKRRRSREVQRSTFARFLALFDFRLLQQYLPEAEVAGACSRVSFGKFAYAAAAIGQLAETPMASKAASIVA